MNRSSIAATAVLTLATLSFAAAPAMAQKPPQSDVGPLTVAPLQGTPPSAGLSAGGTGQSAHDAPPAEQATPEPLAHQQGTTSGVIRPPAVVDPGMKQVSPPQQAFPTPVIPPPGSAGGNPNVVPK